MLPPPHHHPKESTRHKQSPENQTVVSQAGQQLDMLKKNLTANSLTDLITLALSKAEVKKLESMLESLRERIVARRVGREDSIKKRAAAKRDMEKASEEQGVSEQTNGSGGGGDGGVGGIDESWIDDLENRNGNSKGGKKKKGKKKSKGGGGGRRGPGGAVHGV